jgi:hypothetical protein
MAHSGFALWWKTSAVPLGFLTKTALLHYLSFGKDDVCEAQERGRDKTPDRLGDKNLG